MNPLIRDAAAASLTACFIHALANCTQYHTEISLKSFINYAAETRLKWTEMSVSDRLVWRSCVNETQREHAETTFVNIVNGTVGFLSPDVVDAFVARVCGPRPGR